MKNVIVKISLAACILLSSAGVGSAANLLTLNCSVKDPVTGNPRTTFAPGDELLLELNAIAPNDGSTLAPKDRGAHMQISAQAKIAGIKFPFSINESYYLALSETSGTQTQSVSFSDSRAIRLPTQTPKGSTLTFTVRAIVGEVGSGSCKNTISVP